MPRDNSAKDDAPTRREYLDLRRAAENKVSIDRVEDDEARLECTFFVRVMGELGLRAGELTHITEDWIDFNEDIIYIPSHDRCDFGEDDAACGYCKKQARQAARKNEGLSYEKALRDRWSPKNEASKRQVPFGWDPSLVELIHEYFAEHDHVDCSRATLNRRITKVAEYSKLVDEDEIYPHALRSHAAIYHARKGMSAFHLMELMGWNDVSGAMPYIEMVSTDVDSELNRIHSGRRGMT